jgi:hypothetical protein
MRLRLSRNREPYLSASSLPGLSFRTAFGLQTELRAEDGTTTHLVLCVGEPWIMRTIYSWNAGTSVGYGLGWPV